ncbi:MAG: hypothetical protein CL908_15075 [Deltaproteobacteria bacterium]|nr:hypothetical protein [Deltaproteobacteria bacterium]
MSEVRVCVLGAGKMGSLHAQTVVRHAERHGGGRLAAVVDRHLGRAQALARSFGGRASDDLAATLQEVDAVIVAVPTRVHFELTRSIFRAGLDALVEKPLAVTVRQGTELADMARVRSRILQVGHVEWYNPAWRAAALRAGRPLRIEVERLGPPSGRGLDIDVVQDFMLHDLDWVTRFVAEDVVRVAATGWRVLNDGLDVAETHLRFRSGCTARLRASRVHSERRRHVRIEGQDGVVSADLLPPAPALEVAADGSTRAPDPLELQWAAFLESCRTRKPPENDGAVGVASLELADRVHGAIAAGASV